MKLFAIFKNADMIEGRGPMILDSIWQIESNAIQYLNSHNGVMGRSPYYHNLITGHDSRGWHDKEAWPYGGDWEIKEINTKD